MSNLKDTDTDDLFRRASDSYPLRTDSSDWDRMAAALEKDARPPGDGEDSNDRRKKSRFFWLFFVLALVLGGLGYYAWHADAVTEDGSRPVATAAKVLGTSTPPAPVTSASGTANLPSTEAANRGDRSILADAGRLTNGDRNGHADCRDHTDQSGYADRKGHADRKGYADRKGHADRTGYADRRDHADRRGYADRQGNVAHSANANAFHAASANKPGGGDAFSTDLGGAFSSSLTANYQDRLFYDLQREPVGRNYQLTINVAAPATKTDSAKQKTPATPKHPYLYAGLLAAPDLSTVKMQALKGVGNTFGALVGYAFNSHWAIETGAYLERKKYYTEGQYFNTKEIAWPATDTLKNVNGTCYMWEIPLNLRYTFNPEAKTRWFAAAGFTTYLMTSERYTYHYDWSGWTGNSHATIKKPSQYPFSIVSLSAGFEQRLGKVGNLRIEPYLHIPLTGMGTGKLPIMSTGINIGITRQVWKK